MDITVVGLGRVGIVVAASLAAAGHRVLGVDVDSDRIDSFRLGDIPFYEPGLNDIFRSATDAGRLRFAHPGAVDGPLGEVVIIATGTPQVEGGAADLTQVCSAVSWIKSRPSGRPVIVMKSTVPPGAGQSIIEHDLAGSGLRYVSNPEFLREGRAVEDWHNPYRIVVGTGPDDTQSMRVLQDMYAGIGAPYVITDVTSAEMIKYASNAFLATRISFINEISLLCDQVGASVDAVSDGLALDPRTGSRMHAGLGYGGSCFPKDARALDRLGLDQGVDLELLRAVINVNNRQRLRAISALRNRFGDMTGVRVAVLGLAFKPGTDDVREAPAVDLINALVADGAIVAAYDPRATDNARRELPDGVRFAATPSQATIRARAVVLATEWEECVRADWREIANTMRHPRLLFDGRNVLSAAEMQRLSFEYVGVGRSGSRS